MVMVIKKDCFLPDRQTAFDKLTMQQTGPLVLMAPVQAFSMVNTVTLMVDNFATVIN